MTEKKNRGRRINVVDTAVIVLLVALIASVFARMEFFSDFIDSVQENSVTCDLETMLNADQLRLLKTEDSVYFSDDETLFAEISSIDTDYERIKSEDGYAYRVIIKVSASCNVTDAGYKIRGRYFSPGDSLELKTHKISFVSEINSINSL